MKKASKTAKKSPAKKTAQKPAAEIVATIEAAAAAVPINERTLKRWFARGCPKTPGRYDVVAIRAWRDANLKPRHDVNPERSKWEARKARADARLKELELRTRRGEMITVKSAARVVGQAVAIVVTHLDQLPDFAVAGERLPPETKRKLREKLRAKIHDCRTTIEASIRELAREARREGGATVSDRPLEVDDSVSPEAFKAAVAIESVKLLRRTINRQLASLIHDAQGIPAAIDTLPPASRCKFSGKFEAVTVNLLEALRSMADALPAVDAEHPLLLDSEVTSYG